MRRPRRTADATAARYKIVEFIIYPRVLQQSNILYFPRFGIFFLFEKEKQTRGFTPRPRNAVQQYIVRGSQSVARHIRPQTRWSLNECGLVRLASQAVQPSQNIVAYRPWSGRYAPCFSPTSPRFIRHRRRFGDVARLSPLAYQTLRRGY